MSSNPNTPVDIDRLCQTNSLTLKTVRQSLSRELYEIHPFKAWWGLCRGILAIFIFEYLLFQIPWQIGMSLLWTLPATIALWVLLGTAFVGMIILAHDCGHLAFSKNRTINYVVGHICTSALTIGFHNWRLSHHHHHNFTQIRKMDTDWPEKMVTLDEFKSQTWYEKQITKIGFASPLSLIVGFLFGNLRRTFIPLFYPQIHLTKRSFIQWLYSTIMMFLCTGTVIYSLFYYSGFSGLTKFYLGPLLCGLILGSLITLVQHTSAESMVFDQKDWTPLRAHLINTFDVRFPKFVEFLAFNFNIHTPHHISPTIPWYHLKTAAKELETSFPQYYQKKVLNWKDLKQTWHQPLLNKQPDNNYYTMQQMPESLAP